MYMPACASASAGLRHPPWTTHHRAPSSASRPTSGCHTAQGVSRGARVAVRCQGSHHTAVQRPTTRPSCWSLLLLPAATDAHCSPATPSQLTQGRHRAVRSARDVPGSVDPAGMAKWGREGARSLNCRIYVCLIKFPPEIIRDFEIIQLHFCVESEGSQRITPGISGTSLLAWSFQSESTRNLRDLTSFGISALRCLHLSLDWSSSSSSSVQLEP